MLCFVPKNFSNQFFIFPSVLFKGPNSTEEVTTKEKTLMGQRITLAVLFSFPHCLISPMA